ncbi:HAD family hydrolase [Microbispora bryophytorum]|uniref:Phosphatase n=1 Tax=Microbispora bryophytorum TaxID=1460882 RepID=A0A8H9GWS4_9ACTN|nr:HAD-IA family hydrolase [Microbispora bryophytorum]MBD3136245.1 HAD-IA family hydrolase [Microbispora bryophytorum]TQS07977.1 HAD-IA family hydrolase [Microbispora bryophytorum]GGO05295.1 phosphatase [Microbispora bryophytorum]
MAAALFDLDGTLVNTELRSRALWRMFLDDRGITCDETLLRRVMGRRGVDVVPEVLPGMDPEVAMEEIRSYYDHPDLPDIVPVPGAAELVSRVAAHGAPLALVTSAQRWWAVERLTEIGVLEVVRTIVSAEDVTVGKPDPSGYLMAAGLLDVDPATCVVFEDSLAGIAAARAAGMACVAVATTHHPDELSHADLVIPDMSGIDWPLTELPAV